MGKPNIFKILTPPFKATSVTDGLEQISNLLYAIFTGGKCIGFQQLDVTDVAPVSLDIPEGTVYALLVCESDPAFANDKTRLIRIKQFDTEANPPTPAVGMLLGDLGVLEIKDFENLKAFMAIAIDTGFTHKINVEYYG